MIAKPPPEPDRFAGQAFAAHVDAQLAEERATKTSLEARGTALITSSSAFVTLLAAGFALAYGKNPAGVPILSRWCVMLATVALMVAAVAGVLANKPSSYTETDIMDMRVWVDDYWTHEFVKASQQTARCQLDTLETARGKNADKAGVVKVGSWAQVVAVALLVGAVGGLLA